MQIALAVTGSIAAYKAVEVARLLIKRGHKVIPMMTAGGARFVGPVTLSGICGEPCHMDMWDSTYPGELHVAIADRADVLAIVPATCDMLARLAQGRGDDLVTATALCAKGPLVVAPAMHPRMWAHPATQANVKALSWARFVGPVASGDVGMGRLAEPQAIVDAILQGSDLAGKHIVVTAGPTYEPIDPVRFLGNRSSGKMGFAIAEAAARRGAKVTLISGPVALTTPSNVERSNVETAEQMRAALARVVGACDALVMAAAVADFRPASASTSKLKKEHGTPTIELTQNPDLIGEIAANRSGKTPVLVAFALETGDDAAVLAYATAKRARKKVDMIVANAAHESLGRAENRVSFITETGATPFIEGDKLAIANALLDRLMAVGQERP